MICKKFISILTLLTLLFSLTPSAFPVNAQIEDFEITDEIELTEDASGTQAPLVVFDASVSANITNAVSYNTSNTKGSVSSDASNSFAGTHTLKINHSIMEDSQQYEAKISKVNVADITDYDYINLNIYSPESSDEKINILLLNSATTYKSKRFRYALKTDWAGWKTVSIPRSSFTKSSGMTNNINLFDINIGGWNLNKDKAGYFLVDRIWLTSSAPAGVVCSSGEFENGAGYIPEDLGGDNIYSIEFSGDLAETDMTNAVTVEKYDGTQYVDYTGDFEATGNDNKLDVDFLGNLADGTYRINVNPKALLSADYAICTGDVESFEFSVNLPSPYFNMTDSSVVDGSVLTSLTNVTLTFNNELNPSTYIPDYISVYEDGEKIYNSYSYLISDKTIELDFADNLKNGCSYKITISPEFGDILNNLYIGEPEITFSLEAIEEKEKLVIFTAAEEDNFDILDTEYTQSTEITNLYPRTAKLNYEAGDADLNAFITRNNPMDVSGMKYLNFLAYSPVATENPSYIILYKDNALTGNKYELPIDWAGWKIISVPVASISNLTSFDGILFNMGGWKLENVTSGYILFDAVWFSKEMPSELALVSQSFPNGFSSVAPQGQELTLVFNSKLDTEVTPDILVADSAGNSFSDFTYRIEDESLVITFGDLGGTSCEYTLTVNTLASRDFSVLSESVTVNFSTANSGVFLNDIAYSPKDVTVEIENLSSESKNLTLVCYAIGEDNVLVEKQEKLICASCGTINDGITFASNEEIQQVKAFVLNGNNEFLSSKYLSYKNNTSNIETITNLPGKDKEIDNLSYSVEENVVKITADFYALPDVAIVEILSDATVISANVVNVEEGLEYYYVFSSDFASGKYPVTVTSGDVTETVDINYISRQDRAEILELANSGNINLLFNKLFELKSYLPVSNTTDTILRDFADFIVLNKPYTDYTDVVEYLIFLDNLYKEINSSTWSDYAALIEVNSELFKTVNSSAVEYFLGLSGVNQGKLSQLLAPKLPADSISDFVSCLALAVNEYKVSLTPGQNNTNNNHTAKPSVSGGGFGGASFPSGGVEVDPAEKPDPVAPGNKVFNDLGSVEWAEESINLLCEKGIISKPEDRKFRPNDNITREEFTKLVVCAFLTGFESGDKTFSDSAEGAWYNTYLSTAFGAGVISGYPDGSFGVGENISREDMAVICMRAYLATGKTLNYKNPAEFNDIGNVSSYALESVTKMAEAGIINGTGNNNFAPKATATRAEAAKIIASLLGAN